jgi:hypothetical protein
MVSAVGVTGGTWQRFDSTVTELQAACAADVLHSFFHGEGNRGVCLTVDNVVQLCTCRLCYACMLALGWCV